MNEQSNKLILAKVNDEARIAIRDYKTVATSFYDPYQTRVIEKTLSSFDGIQYLRNGGHPNAERSIFIIYPYYLEMPSTPFLQALKIEWNLKYDRVDHRDILGSLIGIGIKRDKIGDIIMSQGFAHVFTTSELAPYLVTELDRVGRASVSVKSIPCDQVDIAKAKAKTIRTTVASPRLDSIIGACFGLSRTKALPYIIGGKVRVNWDTIEKPDHTISAGDVLSIRGLGRGKVVEFQGSTRKERLFIVLEKYI